MDLSSVIALLDAKGIDTTPQEGERLPFFDDIDVVATLTAGTLSDLETLGQVSAVAIMQVSQQSKTIAKQHSDIVKLTTKLDDAEKQLKNTKDLFVKAGEEIEKLNADLKALKDDNKKGVDDEMVTLYATMVTLNMIDLLDVDQRYINQVAAQLGREEDLNPPVEEPVEEEPEEDESE